MNDFVIQGVATQLEKPFVHGDDILILKSGCFDSSLRGANDIKLLTNHDADRCLGSTKDGRLLLHAGEREMVFRFLIGKSEKFLADMADDFESYFPISIGYGYQPANTETEVVDGVKVTSIFEANLHEISILNKAPAIHTTYGRVTSWKNCNGLQEDYELGRFDMVGKFVSLHRAIKAQENGGVLTYNHVTSAYDRAANNFEKALRNLG
jgi:phage head maturation protease